MWKDIGKTVISGKEQKLNKQMAEFGISILFSIPSVHFVQTQYFFKVLKTDFTIQYFQYGMGTLRIAMLSSEIQGIICVTYNVLQLKLWFFWKAGFPLPDCCTKFLYV